MVELTNTAAVHCCRTSLPRSCTACNVFLSNFLHDAGHNLQRSQIVNDKPVPPKVVGRRPTPDCAVDKGNRKINNDCEPPFNASPASGPLNLCGPFFQSRNGRTPYAGSLVVGTHPVGSSDGHIVWTFLRSVGHWQRLSTAERARYDKYRKVNSRQLDGFVGIPYLHGRTRSEVRETRQIFNSESSVIRRGEIRKRLKKR